ncbi:sugar ABC transporter ATP-binding protein [Arthrobacter sp. K5]|uniref:Sugar ABC transporter ATP-binding protein n=1 Tax=Arthrobacter sp. K5 TaxID=2839623 RepID=A0AAU8EYM2_9MICC
MAKPSLAAPSQPEATDAGQRNAIVHVAQVEKSFGETRALRGATFTAEAGEIHAIVGENGSGKSTMAKIMSGILIPDGGSVQIGNHSVPDPRVALKSGVATVFQEVLVAEGASVADNVFMGLKGLSRQEQVRRAKTLLEDLTGERIDASALVDHLTLAQRQWVTIARALVREPKVVIFDESTAALDLPGASRLYSEMEKLRDRGVCVIIVTHRIAELTTFADRATVLRDGIDVGVLAGEEITEDRLIELMTGVATDDTSTGTAGHPRRHPADVSGKPPLLKAVGVVLRHGAGPSDFEIRPGEIIGFAGLDGQGQTEFIQILTGVRPSMGGEVLVSDGQGSYTNIASLPDAVASGVSYISGDRRKEGIFPNLSIMENFAMPLYRTHRRNGVIDRKAISTLFKQMSANLKLRAGAPSNLITSLSGGNQQKVLIGRELAQEPRVVALNDPARGVDVRTKRELYAQLDTLASAGTGVIYLSSEIDELLGLCDRVAIFRNGSLFGWLEGEKLTSDRVLAGMFGHLESDFNIEEALVEQS